MHMVAHHAATMTMPGDKLMLISAIVMLVASVLMLVSHVALVLYVKKNKDKGCSCA